MFKIKCGLLIIALVLLSAILTAPMSAAPTDPDWVQVWADECNGAANSAVDGSKWNLVNSGGGFGNNELQFYTNRTANSYYDGAGNMVIKTIKESYSGYNYTSAKLYSQNKGDWKYCRVSIRAKLPHGRCVWPAFWMMPTASSYGGWPVCGEIDMMENRGDQMNKVGGTIHFGNPWKYIGASYTLSSGTFDAGYHTFDMEWEAGTLRWYVDGSLYETRTHTEWYCSAVSESTNPYAPFDQNFYLQLNTAVGGPNTPYTGNQSPDDSVFPQSMYIDYVRVYQRGSGPSPSPAATPTATKTPTTTPGQPTPTPTATPSGGSLPSTTWYPFNTAVSGVSPAGQNMQTTHSGTNGWQPTTSITTTSKYWYSTPITGTYNAGTWTFYLWTNNPGASSQVAVEIAKVNSDGSGATVIATQTKEAGTSGGGNHATTYTFSGISAQSLSNQLLRVKITKASGVDLTMAYNTNDFPTRLVTP